MHYTTGRLPFAAYLHCTQKLEFVRCEEIEPRKAVFLFNDPTGLGEQLELEFDQGCGTVDPRAFVTSERFLKRKLFQVILKREAKANVH